MPRNLTDSESQRYGFADVLWVPVDANSFAVYSRLTNSWGHLSSIDLAVLTACCEFDTVSGHIARWGKRGQAQTIAPSTLQRVITSLVSRRLLVTQEEIIQQLVGCSPSSSDDSPNEQLRVLSIPTKDRAESLDRAVRSFAKNAELFGRDIEYWIVDDSRSAVGQLANLEKLRALDDKTLGVIRYADIHDRARFAAVLAKRAGVSLEIARSALLGDERISSLSFGAARNTQLFGIGQRRWISVDDDTICDIKTLVEGDSGVCIAGSAHSEAYEGEYSFQDSVSSPNDPHRDIAWDFIGHHENVLGHTLKNLVSTVEGSDITIENVGVGLVEKARRHGLRVVMTSNGFTGDCATGLTNSLLTLGEANFGRLIANRNISRLLHDRQVTVSVRQTTFTEMMIPKGLVMGIDGASDIPPFCPFGRGENDLCLFLARHSGQGYLSAILPPIITHDPPEPRKGLDMAAVEILTPSSVIPRLLEEYVGTRPLPIELKALGEHMVDVSNWSPRCFSEFVLTRWWQNAASLIKRLRERHDRAGSAQVRAELKAVADAFERGVRGYLESADDESHWHRQRMATRSYGQILLHWDEITEAARTLSYTGDRLFHRI
jgi:hypothetical protein